MAKKETNVTPVTTQDLFDGLIDEAATSTMTVWSSQLQTLLDKAPSVKFAEGKRSTALEAVHKWAEAQSLNPIVRYVVNMGLKTLNRKVGK